MPKFLRVSATFVKFAFLFSVFGRGRFESGNNTANMDVLSLFREGIAENVSSIEGQQPPMNRSDVVHRQGNPGGITL
jgi:hypothetical protein